VILYAVVIVVVTLAAGVFMFALARVAAKPTPPAPHDDEESA
jgi:hypothetical protein